MKTRGGQMIRTFVFTMIVASFCIPALADIHPVVPDPDMTPGELCDTKDPDFKEYRYREKIPYCQRDVSRARKTQIYLNYSVSLKKRNQYTIDHFIPLSIGGDNSDENLWPEHKEIKKLRQNLELDVFESLRDGYITQEEAIEMIIEAKLNPPLEISVFEGILYTKN